MSELINEKLLRECNRFSSRNLNKIIATQMVQQYQAAARVQRAIAAGRMIAVIVMISVGGHAIIHGLSKMTRDSVVLIEESGK